MRQCFVSTYSLLSRFPEFLFKLWWGKELQIKIKRICGHLASYLGQCYHHHDFIYWGINTRLCGLMASQVNPLTKILKLIIFCLRVESLKEKYFNEGKWKIGFFTLSCPVMQKNWQLTGSGAALLLKEWAKNWIKILNWVEHALRHF